MSSRIKRQSPGLLGCGVPAFEGDPTVGNLMDGRGEHHEQHRHRDARELLDGKRLEQSDPSLAASAQRGDDLADRPIDNEQDYSKEREVAAEGASERGLDNKKTLKPSRQKPR